LQSDCIAIAYTKIFSSKEVNALYLIVMSIRDDSPQNPQSVVGNQPLAISQKTICNQRDHQRHFS